MTGADLMDKWELDLTRIVNRMIKTAGFVNYNMPNRRIEDSMGNEAQSIGFNSIVLYFQLSTKLIYLE